MPRTWTQAVAADWRKHCAKRCAQQGNPLLKALALEKERRELLEDETARLKMQAWPVGTHLMVAGCGVAGDAVLELPRAHRVSGNADFVSKFLVCWDAVLNYACRLKLSRAKMLV